MATHGFEQSALMKPLEQLKARGARVEVAAPEAGEIRGWQKKDWGKSIKVDLTLEQVKKSLLRARSWPMHGRPQLRARRYRARGAGERQAFLSDSRR